MSPQRRRDFQRRIIQLAIFLAALAAGIAAA